MHVCDRCRSESEVHPTRVSLSIVRVDIENTLIVCAPDKNSTGTVDLCGECRSGLGELLNDYLRPVPVIEPPKANRGTKRTKKREAGQYV